MVHDMLDIESGFGLPHDITHERIGDKLPKFRGKIWDDLSFLPFSHLGISIIPPRTYDGILESGASFALEVVIREEADEICDGSTLWIIEEGETSIAEIVLDTRTKYLISKKFDHDIGRITDDHLFLIFTIGFQEIETHRT